MFIRKKIALSFKILPNPLVLADFAAFDKACEQSERKAKKGKSAARSEQKIDGGRPEQKKRGKGDRIHDAVGGIFSQETGQGHLRHSPAVKARNGQQIQKSQQERNAGKRVKKGARCQSGATAAESNRLKSGPAAQRSHSLP